MQEGEGAEGIDWAPPPGAQPIWLNYLKTFRKPAVRISVRNCTNADVFSIYQGWSWFVSEWHQIYSDPTIVLLCTPKSQKYVDTFMVSLSAPQQPEGQ